MVDRAANIHYAKVCIAQSRHFTRRQRGFSFVLLRWAGNARRRTMTQTVQPVQGDLFGACRPTTQVTGGRKPVPVDRLVRRH